MENSKISIIMGIYNCADTLSVAIDSILDQTYTNWELIMCDDASTDDTYNIAMSYKEKYPEKIILIKNEKNLKLSYTLNHCLQYVTGKYVARMDGDDRSLPERFTRQIQYLQAHPEIDLVGTAMQRFNDEGLADITCPKEHPDKYILRRGVPFDHATIMTYKYVYDRLNGYTVSERTKRSQDYDLWFRFYAAGFRGDNIQEPLYLVKEDIAAIKRRTFNNRLNIFKTTCYGFKLLGFPKRWLIRPVIDMIIKSIIPSRIIYLYREYQKKSFQKENGKSSKR